VTSGLQTLEGTSSADSNALDVERVRADFPMLRQEMRGKPLVYLDSGASAQKPQAVIDAISDFYANHYSSVHRGVYHLSDLATRDYEEVRRKTAAFIGATDPREIVFVRNTTEAINLVAQTWGRENIGAGDEILISHMEHHSNIVPWQMLCEQTGAVLRVASIDDRGELELESFDKLLCEKTKLVALTHVSNALGTINPVRELCARAQREGALVLLDGAQGVPHMSVDVRDLGCDFYAFSGHKVFGPTGAGVLWARLSLLEAMPPYMGGGSMISSVSFDGTQYADPPERFEAGTPDIAGVLGLGAALDYVTSLGMDRIAAWELELLGYATEALSDIPGLRLIGTAREKAAVLSFVLDCAHPHDIGTIFDGEGVAIRAGHHCAQPTMERFGVPATARASLAMYNTRADIDALVLAIHKTREIFA
jgi:cysteine desulfurase/selenocysteine lyase